MRLWSRLWSVKNRFKESLPIENGWPDALKIRVAEREPELERAFRILHDTYVKAGLMREQPSEMRVLPQQLLPQTSTIVALWNDKVIATLSLIRDNPLGLPMESIFSLDSERKGGKRLAEISLLSVDPIFRESHAQLIYPLFRFVYQYAVRCFGIQKFVISVSPELTPLYHKIFLFESLKQKLDRPEFENGAVAVGLSLDLEEAPRRWQEEYGNETSEYNLAQYLSSEANHKGCELPSRDYGIASDLVMTPQMLERLYLKKAGLLTSLKKDEIRALRDAYPHESFENLLQHISWAEDGAPKRELRLDAQMSASIPDRDTRLRVRNISRHGLQVYSDKPLQMDEVITIEVRLNDKQQTRICAQVKWADSSDCYGLRILSYSSEWGQMLQSIEGRFAKLAAAN